MIAERVREQIEEAELSTEGVAFRVTVSIGLAGAMHRMLDFD